MSLDEIKTPESHTEIIKKRIDRVIQNPETKEVMISEYATTLGKIGIEAAKANEVASEVIRFIEDAKNLEEAEGNIKTLFESTKIGEKNILELIREGLTDRVNVIIGQIRPILNNHKGKVFDYGMGAGEVTQKIHDEFNVDVEGGDVRDFRSKDVNVPFVRLNSLPDEQGRIIPKPDKYYDAAVLTNVIHHEKNNENLLKELDRAIGKKLVIIETIPREVSQEDLDKEMDVVFVNDVLWNRFFNYADIPVPGAFEKWQKWIERFEKDEGKKYGHWKISHHEDLGIDQKTINARHYLLVFERS